MSQEAINRSVRRSRRSRVLGPDASCSHCGCTDQTALVVRTRQKQRVILCYECAQATSRKVTTEQHHVIGRENDPDLVIEVPGNTHRALSDLQRDWPVEVRHNHSRDPFLELAGMCLSLKDHLLCWIERLWRVASWLVECSRKLREHFGTPQWWIPLGLPPLWGEAAA